ncbi:MAG: hypothetical protein ABIH99_02305, partial [Candidatus Micrarchaeota archaeon]
MPPSKEINDAFKKTFALIFGECNLELEELKDYLLLYLKPAVRHNSSISGKDVLIAPNNYPENARFISQDEIDFSKNFALNINEIKDIDSITSAIADRAYFTGNKVFGNSKFTSEVDDCIDSFHVYNSRRIQASKYIAHSTWIRENSEYCFGSAYLIRGSYIIRVHGAYMLARSFEANVCTQGSDLFFCYDCTGCSHVMFSSSQRSKNYMIGNLQLPKEKYFELRKKLIDESREYIEKNKCFYSMYTLPLPVKKPLVKVSKLQEQKTDFAKIDEAFKATSRVIFGREIGSLKNMDTFLGEPVRNLKKVKTAFGSEIYTANIFYWSPIPSSRVASMEEADELGKQHISLEKDEEITLNSLLKKVSPLFFFKMKFLEGACSNNIENPLTYT